MALEQGTDTVPRSRLFELGERFSAVDPLVAGIVVLTVLRFVLGAVLPLSFDEAYYWLWSRHPALGYYDHPPAIAWMIRLGTEIFGGTSFGVRFVPLLLSLVASWSVWRTAAILTGDARAGLRACLYFNATLMVAAESMTATPDAPALAFAALVLFALARLEETGNSRWWLAAGAAGGLCLLSKYTGFFLGAGVLIWLVVAPQGRRWLATPWPWLAGAIALLFFAPALYWNAKHDWMSFRLQFGRTERGGWTAAYLVEFLLAQALLASPLILILGGAGFARAADPRSAGRIALVATVLWPSLVYFALHALHDRVQGNWPSFAYPALAILASYGATLRYTGSRAATAMSWIQRGAMPVALLLLSAVYAQAFFGIVRARDPIARLTAMEIRPLAERVAKLAQTRHARAIVTTSYATTGWLAFYVKAPIPVVDAEEPFRWLAAPPAPPLSNAQLLYVTMRPKKGGAEHFPALSGLHWLDSVQRRRRGALIETYDIYAASGLKGDFRVP
jgi:4-amino-4-deoxy-L-arabinose transferase-like glycosyltransferase